MLYSCQRQNTKATMRLNRIQLFKNKPRVVLNAVYVMGNPRAGDRERARERKHLKHYTRSRLSGGIQLGTRLHLISRKCRMSLADTFDKSRSPCLFCAVEAPSRTNRSAVLEEGMVVKFCSRKISGGTRVLRSPIQCPFPQSRTGLCRSGGNQRRAIFLFLVRFFLFFVVTAYLAPENGLRDLPSRVVAVGWLLHANKHRLGKLRPTRERTTLFERAILLGSPRFETKLVRWCEGVTTMYQEP